MSKKLEIIAQAPDFEIKDLHGNLVRLSEVYRRKPVILVMNRGFVWPYCRAHMAQLRQDKARFDEIGAEVLILGPDGPNAFRKYWAENDIPFVGLPDLRSRVAHLYEQEYNLFKFGRMPALFIIDQQGIIRYAHYGDSMSDIPPNEVLFEVLKQLTTVTD